MIYRKKRKSTSKVWCLRCQTNHKVGSDDTGLYFFHALYPRHPSPGSSSGVFFWWRSRVLYITGISSGGFGAGSLFTCKCTRSECRPLASAWRYFMLIKGNQWTTVPKTTFGRFWEECRPEQLLGGAYGWHRNEDTFDNVDLFARAERVEFVRLNISPKTHTEWIRKAKNTFRRCISDKRERPFSFDLSGRPTLPVLPF